MIRSLLRNLTRLCMAAVLLVLSVCAVEVGLRALRVRSRLESPPNDSQGALSRLQLTQPSRTSYLDVIPLLDITRRPDGADVYQIRTDEWGLRGGSVAVPKPRGVLRVICLGGEETFAPHLDEAAAYPHQLQLLLQRGTSLKVEVLNGGCPQAGPLVNLLRLRQLLALQPDLIVLTVSPPDLRRDSEVRRFLHLDQAGHATYAVHPHLRKESTLLDPICEEFVVADWLVQFASREMLMSQVSSESGVRRRPADGANAAEAEAALAMEPILAAAELARGIYAKCVVAVCPSVWEMRTSKSGEDPGERPADGERIRNLLQNLQRNQSLPLCDVTEEFRNRTDLRQLFSASAGQLSAEGHALFAARLGRFIVENVPDVWQRQP